MLYVHWNSLLNPALHPVKLQSMEDENGIKSIAVSILPHSMSICMYVPYRQFPQWTESPSVPIPQFSSFSFLSVFVLGDWSCLRKKWHHCRWPWFPVSHSRMETGMSVCVCVRVWKHVCACVCAQAASCAVAVKQNISLTFEVDLPKAWMEEQTCS